MGNKHLSEDNIKYVVSAETSKAQEEIHSLTKETNKLKLEEKERKKAMVELEAQGQKNSRRYKNLTQETKDLSDKIKENNKRIKEFTKGLDVNAMSTRQLKKLAKELTAQLDDMSEAVNPEEYAKLNKQLQGVRSRMSDLRSSGDNVSQGFGQTQSALSKLKGAAVAFITVKLAGYLQQIGLKAYETRKEFAKYEATLRNALQSQEKAANSMKMLQQLAADTPASLKEWTEAFIKLVNRGINPTSSELINLGDVASSQGKDVDQFIEAMLDAMTGENERLKEFGIRASKNGDTVKYTFRGVTTEVQNSEEAIKNYLLSLGKLDGVAGSMAVQMKELEGLESNFGDTMDNMWNKLGKRLEPFFKKALTWASDFVSDVSKAIEPLSDTFDSQLDKVISLETTLPGMTKRYEELTGKVNLNVTEQKELNTLIEQLSTIVPSAVSEWDQYGNVISINTGKVNQYLASEKARLNYINREEIKSLKEKKKNAQEEMHLLVAQNKKGQVWAGGTGYGNTKDSGMRDMTAKEKTDNAIRIKELAADLHGMNAQLDKISGESVDKIVKNRIKAQSDATTAQQRFNSMNKTMLSAWLKDEKNAADQHKEIAQQIYNTRFPETNSTENKSDPNAVSIKNMESAHADEINQIRLSGQQKQQAEEEINLAILASDKTYYTQRIAELEKFKATEKKSSKQAEYQKQIVDSRTKLLNTEVALEKQSIATIEKLRTDGLANESETTKAYQLHYTKELANKKISKEQYEMLILSLDYSSAETRLAIEQRYLNDVNDLELNNGQLKSDAVKRANDAVLVADQSAANARAAQQTKLDDLVKDFKTQFKVTTVDEDHDAQKAVLEASYLARKKMAEKENMDTATLDAAYNRASEQLEADHQAKIQSVRDQYGISTQQERFNAELLQLKAARDQGLIVEEDYEKAVKNLKRDSYKQQFDYYSDLFAGAVNALQQAEMDNVDAKYDAEIEAAQGNAEEVERLENEKAQKKLDIEKKYADINFAIKASQIIADTAVSIMKAIADLGPIAGPIAAALMGVTGAAQLVSANAERQKVKNMTLSGSKSSKTGTRVATGRESGGSIDVRRAQDGKFFPAADYNPDARGFIDRPTVIVGEGPTGQSKEWVASNAAVQNPTVAPILNLLDKAQQAGTIRTLDLNQAIRANMAGYSTGGSISQTTATPSPQSQPSNTTIPGPLMLKLANAIISIDDNGVAASVSLTDFERKQQLRDRSRSIGSKS